MIPFRPITSVLVDGNIIVRLVGLAIVMSVEIILLLLGIDRDWEY